MKFIHAFFAALLAAALTLPLSACSAVLPDAYTVNEDAADAPEAVSGTEYTVRFPVSPYGEAVSETTASDDGDTSDTASDCAAYIKSKVDSLFVRSGPGTEYPVLGTLDNGDMTAYSGKENGWYVTVCKEQTAYVSANAEYTSVYLIPKGSPEVESVIAAAISERRSASGLLNRFAPERRRTDAPFALKRTGTLSLSPEKSEPIREFEQVRFWRTR